MINIKNDLNRNATTALDIHSLIAYDRDLNPNWVPTREQLINRVHDFCDQGDPNFVYNRDAIIEVILFIHL